VQKLLAQEHAQLVPGGVDNTCLVELLPMFSYLNTWLPASVCVLVTPPCSCTSQLWKPPAFMLPSSALVRDEQRCSVVVSARIAARTLMLSLSPLVVGLFAKHPYYEQWQRQQQKKRYSCVHSVM
jgi:hypothetical protein